MIQALRKYDGFIEPLIAQDMFDWVLSNLSAPGIVSFSMRRSFAGYVPGGPNLRRTGTRITLTIRPGLVQSAFDDRYRNVDILWL